MSADEAKAAGNAKPAIFGGLAAVGLSLKSDGAGGGGGITGALVPPVLQQVGQLAAGVASVCTSSGSATGNPRNKCALKPGHSLMDWIRLGSSGKDLTGVGPLAGHLRVTKDELLKHNKKHDAWTAINGIVYNITEYMNFHPGGADELMKGAGRDATELFNGVHPWVNYRQILQKCVIGKYVTSTQDSKTPVVSITALAALPQEYHWSQTSSNIVILLNTPPLTNPFVDVSKDTSGVTIHVRLSKTVSTYRIRLTREFTWPARLHVNHEIGKVEITLRKAEPFVWEELGKVESVTRKYIPDNLERIHYDIISRKKINDNCYRVRLKRADRVLYIPLGYHINIYKGDHSRPYTPVPQELVLDPIPDEEQVNAIDLVIKSYPDGNVSKFVCEEHHTHLIASEPYGEFNLQSLEDSNTFMFITGGTGITPMLGIVLYLLKRRKNPCLLLKLQCFYRRMDDIIMQNELTSLEEQDKRFVVDIAISREENRAWKGSYGSVKSREFMETATRLETPDKEKIELKSVHFLVCGPSGFVLNCRETLGSLGAKGHKVYTFPG